MKFYTMIVQHIDDNIAHHYSPTVLYCMYIYVAYLCFLLLHCLSHSCTLHTSVQGVTSYYTTSIKYKMRFNNYSVKMHYHISLVEHHGE